MVVDPLVNAALGLAQGENDGLQVLEIGSDEARINAMMRTDTAFEPNDEAGDSA